MERGNLGGGDVFVGVVVGCSFVRGGDGCVIIVLRRMGGFWGVLVFLMGGGWMM